MSSTGNVLNFRDSNAMDSFSVEERNIINHAISIIEGKFKRESLDPFTSTSVTYEYLRLQVEVLEREVFGVLFLDNQHRLIANEVLFKGTIDAASVNHREVVKRALELNSSATIFYHNHPSGISEPSTSDIRITGRLKDALSLIDIKVLDHFIIGSGCYSSLAEKGRI